MSLYLLDYGAGNVQSLANSLTKLGYDFSWINCPDDFRKANVLIFPGVGAFQSAVDTLEERGLFEPLRKFILSGKPYFGICIGLQILFESSTESPGSKGFGLIPLPIEKFDDASKSVPHMGWNNVTIVDRMNAPIGVSTSAFYYFVHSYRALYDRHNPRLVEWAHSTTQYGSEVFISSICKGNVFGTQFHPEKSGDIGLHLLKSWLSVLLTSPMKISLVVHQPTPPDRPLKAHDGFTRRIVACLDVRTNDEGDLVVTKGDQYDVRENSTSASSGAVRNLGKPVALASRYYAQGADEICLLNITSFRNSPLRDQPMLTVVSEVAKKVFVPLTIGGGIKDTTDPDGTPHSALEVAGAYFRAGADKVSIGTEAVIAVERLLEARSKQSDSEPVLAALDPESAIEAIARVYGRQAVVVSVDPKRVYVDPRTYDGPHRDELMHDPEDDKRAWYYACTIRGGRELRPLSALQLCRGVEALGAGEILLNSIDKDGTKSGFDIELINLVRRHVRIPIVASSGAGSAAHFVEVFEKTGVEAALAAGIFHRREVKISEVKDALQASGIAVRRRGRGLAKKE